MNNYIIANIKYNTCKFNKLGYIIKEFVPGGYVDINMQFNSI